MSLQQNKRIIFNYLFSNHTKTNFQAVAVVKKYAWISQTQTQRKRFKKKRKKRKKNQKIKNPNNGLTNKRDTHSFSK